MNIQQYAIATKKFNADNGFLHASALTFYTIFAVVPVLAVVLGISKGFGLDDFLKLQLNKVFPGQETVVKFLSQYAHNLLMQTSGGLIAGVALLLLFYSVYSMLNHIEQAMNKIWQVPRPRSIATRISHYLSLVLIAPIMLISAVSLKILISKPIYNFNSLLFIVGHGFSFLLISLLFTWLYQYMPNTKVKAKAALAAGFHVSIVYIIIQSLLIESQIFMAKYSAVYGSLAVLPIFLIWIQFSWVIVLYGAQLCFVLQNNVRHIWETDVYSLAANIRNNMLLKIAHTCIANFKLDKPPISANELSQEFNLPLCSVMQLLKLLEQANILRPTASSYSDAIGYQPAKNTAVLDDQFILNAINNVGENSYTQSGLA